MPITFRQVEHTYQADSPFSYAALKGIDLDIQEGKVTAIIGETGSGKSTLVQHLNALLLPTGGEIEILDKTIIAKEKPKNLKALRKQVGLVFQFPEYQLFEETIARDISFGPKNFGVSEEEALQRTKDVLKVVGLDESYMEKSPFDLSGGQKRRIAIAGILAMDPSVLVLDEPTALPQNTLLSIFTIRISSPDTASSVAAVIVCAESRISFISGALAAMLDLGKGSGPMNHAFDIQSKFTKENSEAEQ